MIRPSLYQYFYPDDSKSGTNAFYRLVRSKASSASDILNLGAGPGPTDAPRSVSRQGKRVIGIDIDPAVLNNPELDEAFVIGAADPWPIENSSIDLIYSDYVLEHVEHPRILLRESFRVLRPGGHFMFRTPNLFHYVALASRFTPHWIHLKLANRSRGLHALAHDPYPTFYRMNTRSKLKALASSSGLEFEFLQLLEAEPSYMVFNPLAFLVGVGYERLVNASDRLAGLRANLIGSMRKPLPHSN